MLATMGKIFLHCLCEQGIKKKKMREDRTALNQIFSFVVMPMRGLFEI